MKNILSYIKGAMNIKKAEQLVKVLPLLMLSLNSLSLSAQEVEVSDRWAGITHITVYAVMHGGVNGEIVSNNNLGFHITYDTGDGGSSKVNFISAQMNQHGVKSDDANPITDQAKHVHTKAVDIVGGAPSFHFSSSKYWFYIECIENSDDGSMAYTHTSMSDDLTSIYIYSRGDTWTGWLTNHYPIPKFKIYRVPIEVLLDSNANGYCGIKVKNSTIALNYNSRNVEIYVDDDYKGKQDGTAIFSERTWDVSDLTVSPATGYYMDASKGSGTGKTKVGDKSGGTYKVYLVTKYTVEYKANGGSGTVSSQTHTYNQTQALATNSFTKTGYHFTGWNTKADGTGTSYSAGQNVTNLTKDKNGKITLYAQWAPNTYTVNFNSNGGSGSMNSQTFTYDVAQNLNTNVFTKSGYGFSKWNTQADGKGTDYTDNQSVSNLTSAQGGVVTLYAQWNNLYKYSLVYDANTGTGAPAAQNTDWLTESTHTFTISSEVPTKTGYKFLGWYDAKTGGNKIEGTITVTGTSGSTVAKTLYAQWKAGESDLTINVSNLTSGEHVLLQVESLSGEGKGTVYTVALAKGFLESVTLKDLPIGEYKVTALDWSMAEDLINDNTGTTSETKDITGGAVFDFTASAKENPQNHKEASKYNVWPIKD